MGTASFALCSNELERLLTAFVEDIALSCQENSLLAFRCIVPSQSLRVWLMLKLVERGVAPLRGEILILDEVLVPKIASKRALLPLLISFFEKNKKNSLFFRFFGSSEEDLSQKQIVHLAKKYLLPFAQKIFLDDGTWFKKKGFEDLAEAFSAFAVRSKNSSFGSFSRVPTYLFGFSSLHAGVLGRLRGRFDVQRLYFLSPSTLFWGDICSDSEIRAFYKKNNSEEVNEAFLPYITDRQKLLANSGLIGREFLNLLEDFDLPVEGAFIVPEPFFSLSPYTDFIANDNVEKKESIPSLLDHVKADLLFLIGKRSSLYNIPKDDSIEIHAAYTPLREVEALFDALSRIFREREMKPASVIVLTTCLQQYKAPFEEVFGEKFLYKVWGGSHSQEEMSLLHLLFNFLQTQGGKEDILPLIRHSSFLKGFGVSNEEKEELFAFIEQQDFLSIKRSVRERYLIGRGINPSHQVKTLESLYREELEKFFEKGSSLTKKTILSFFARFFDWIDSIEKCCAFPIEENEIEFVATWVSLFETVFSPFVEENGSFVLVEKVLFSLKEYEQDAFLPFQEIKCLFFAELEDFEAQSPQAMNAPIILAEFGSFQPFPAEVIAILGAEEGSLPREEKTPLQYLEKLPPTLYPSSKLIERYAFIEAILAAKRLFIGYQSFAFELREKRPYSALVADLVLHLDSNYIFQDKKPSLSLFFQHSLHRKKRKSFLKSKEEPHLFEAKESCKIDLKEIQKTAKNPISRFIKTTFGVVDEWEENTSIFIKAYEVKMHLEEKILGKTRFSKRNHFLAQETYEAAAQEISSSLKEIGIHSFSRVHVELVPTINTSFQEGEVIFLSPLHCKGFFLEGTWKGLMKEGVFLFSDAWGYELFQKWPECVFRAYLAKNHGIEFQEHIYSLFERKEIFRTIKNPDELFEAWVEFSRLSCHFPFPFSYDIVKLLLKTPSIEELTTKIIAEKHAVTCGLNAQRVEQYKALWEDWAHRLYGDLLQRAEV